MTTRPLCNRVDPFGELRATPARGALMGNRGGRLHRDDRTLSRRRWASRQWIACVCEFKARRREVWGRSYTELFFLDEPTALAAGHRPCFECRRADAERFRRAWNREAPPSAPEMDAALHSERLSEGRKRIHVADIADLPDGAMIERDGKRLRGSRRSFGAVELPRVWRALSRDPGAGASDLLTPPSIVAALAAGYEPRWASTARLDASACLSPNPEKLTG